MNRLTTNDARSLYLKAAGFGGLDVTKTVDWVSKGVNHAADERIADRHAGDLGGALDGVAFFNRGRLAHDHDTDVILLEVERHALCAVGKLNDLSEGYASESVGTGDSISYAQD